MEKIKQTEFLILLILWIGSISTYSLALINNNDLFISDYLGLLGLIIVTGLSFYKPEKAIVFVIVLLALGLFNILSFAYFINVVLSFEFSIIITPGIQLISLTLLTILFIFRKEEVILKYNNIFSKTEIERHIESNRLEAEFRIEFEKMKDQEITTRLQSDLITEAKKVLLEIQEERKNTEKP